MKLKLINEYSLAAAFLSILISGLFIFWGHKAQYRWVPDNKPYCFGYTITAYNFFKNNSLFYWYEKDLFWENGVIVSRLPASPIPVGNHPVVETIGYSFIIGLLWKLTGQANIHHVQVLWILLFAFAMLFIFQIALFVFESKKTAFFACIMVLMFFPLVFTLIEGRNDIWVFFGSVAMLYIVTQSLQNYLYKRAFFGGVTIALMQWVRSSLFGVVLFSMFFTFIYGWFTNKKNLIEVVRVVIVTNIFFFWIPLFIFNKIYYGRFMVGPLGLLLLVGLGDGPNKWGIECSDAWCMNVIPFELGTPEFDDQAKQLFLTYIVEDPLYWVISVFRRILRLVLWNFTWFDYYEYYYPNVFGIKEKFIFLFSNKYALCDFIFRSLYIRFFLLFAYLGMVLAFIKESRFIFILLVFGVMWAVPIALFSHIEDRYVVVTFWIASFFVTYFLRENFNYFIKRKQYD